jgi:hypothetical protein
MRLSLSRSIYTLLLLLPLSFKIQLSENIAVYPQEIIIPLIILIFYIVKPKELKWLNKTYLKPYYILFGALLIVTFCTLLSFFNIVSLSGLLKCLKYLFYCYTILLVSNHSFSNFSSLFIKIGIWVVSLTLGLFLFNFLTSGLALQQYYQRAMWVIDLVPSGFSNLNFSLSTFSFERGTGNHGIYGSYLVLLYLFIISSIKNSEKGFTWKSSIYLLLITFNLFLLPSRESLLIFIIINLLFIINAVNLKKIKIQTFAVFIFLMAVVTGFLVFSETEIVLISKIRYTINSFLIGGSEGNISLRFNVWYLTLLSFLVFPFHLLIGYGYNSNNFVDYLIQTKRHYHLDFEFATVPESFFFMFLSYGGLFALLLAIIFFFWLILKTYSLKRSSSLGLLFFLYTVMLFITNNTGGSMLSDLLFAQYSLVYLYQFKLNEA